MGRDSRLVNGDAKAIVQARSLLCPIASRRLVAAKGSPGNVLLEPFAPGKKPMRDRPVLFCVQPLVGRGAASEIIAMGDGP